MCSQEKILYKPHNKTKTIKVKSSPFSLKLSAFTLVELIIVVTILAILGTIGFFSIQSFTQEARDVKRLTDVKSLFEKIIIGQTKGNHLSELINVSTGYNLQVNGNPLAWANLGEVNRENLREPRDNFLDPSNKASYPFAYSTGEGYSYVQGATINEKSNKAVLVGNYFKTIDTDAPSLFVKCDIIEGEKVCKYLENEGDDYPYTEGGKKGIFESSCIANPSLNVGLSDVNISNDENLISNTLIQDDDENSACYFTCKDGYNWYPEDKTCINADNGKCGIANGMYLDNEPQEPDLCIQGTATPITTNENGTYSWTCNKVLPKGNDDACSTVGKYEDISPDIVKDNRTGLMWQKDGTDSGPLGWQKAKDYCADLELDGYTDWRMPDHIELATLTDFSQASAPYINTDILITSSNENYRYWTSITRLDDHTKAWNISHSNGNSDTQVKTLTYNVRCVRYGEPAPLQPPPPEDNMWFKEGSNNSVVIDGRTMLEWQADGTATGTLAWQNAKDYCAGLELNGYKDWRLPDQIELGSLVNLNNSASPYINRKYFTSASTDPYYRTSITLLTDHSKAWYVGFNNGNSSTIIKTTLYNVRCVRYGDTEAPLYIPPEPKVKFHSGNTPGGDSVVIDERTELYWQSNGTGTGSVNWDDAKKYCKNLDIGGFEDWRLPDHIELASILDFEVTSPYINPALFTISNTTNRPYWTSSTLYSNADNAWYINFNTGNSTNIVKTNATLNVRCVTGREK